MTGSRFQSLRTWFWLSVLWLVLAVGVAVFGVLGPASQPVALVALWVAAWFFAVWTIAVGVRVGLRR